MKHYAILLGSMAAFFLALFGIVEALHLPLLTDPGPWFTSKTLRTALLGVGLLVADVLLPIPSSLVMIAHGLCFGFAVGALLSLVGSVGAGLVAFSLGRYGHPLLRRLIPPAEKTPCRCIVCPLGRPGYPGDTTDSDSGRNHGDPRWRLAHQLATHGAGDRCRLAARCPPLLPHRCRCPDLG